MHEYADRIDIHASSTNAKSACPECYYFQRVPIVGIVDPPTNCHHLAVESADGSILVNLESHCVVDLLPDRTANAVSQ